MRVMEYLASPIPIGGEERGSKMEMRRAGNGTRIGGDGGFVPISTSLDRLLLPISFSNLVLSEVFGKEGFMFVLPLPFS